jgi:DNA polymerase-1
VPVNFHEEDFRLKEWDKNGLMKIFGELEFRNAAKRLLGEELPVSGNIQTDLFGNPVQIKTTNRAQAVSDVKEMIEEESVAETDSTSENILTIDTSPHQYVLCEAEGDIKKLIENLASYSEICFDTETTSLDANNCELVGLSFSVEPQEGYYVPVPKDRLKTKELLSLFTNLFEDETKKWIGQNLKYDLLVLKWYGVEIKGELFDTMLAHYVIEPEGKRSMDELSRRFLHYAPIPIEELIGKKGKSQGNMRDANLEKIKDYAAEDADITLRLKRLFAPRIIENDVVRLFEEVENPLVKVLTDMEYEGVRIDEQFLKDYSSVLEKEAKEAEEKVYAAAGVRFNLASPKQLGEILFEHLRLDPKAKKTKTGQYATDESILQKLASVSPVVSDILTFRELTKLRSTYVDSLPQLINRKTGRVHTTYAQAVAVTGRLASSNPNLQNIPVRTARGREIRKAFVPRDNNHILLSADYSQIELRIVAAISGDPAMCAAFIEGKDIHTATAAKVYNVKEEEVTKEMRYKAKSVNFGIIYGQGAFGLAENLGISRTEAKEIIDNYKKEFTGIQRYMDETIQFAKTSGYVQTLMGRKRWLRDINSSNFTVRGFAERNAINSPIQGTAADMIKMAMIRIHLALKNSSFKSKMILQVHDELVFDVLKDEIEPVKKLVLQCMQEAMTLPNGVPVIAEAGTGENWLDAH